MQVEETTAASLVPSLDDVMSFHLFEDDPTSLQVHVSPESVDVQIDESEEVAASLVPSLEEVMPHQS